MANTEDIVMLDKLLIDNNSQSETYVKFEAKPLMKGYGHTLGNALRRILLSSIDGVAISSIKIDGVHHEFSSIPGIVEDVTTIVLNIKNVRIKCAGELPRKFELIKKKNGIVTAGDIKLDSLTEVVNPEQVICTIDDIEKVPENTFRMEIEITSGQGYRSFEDNKRDDQPIGVIPVDSLFSPVTRVSYEISDCRVGQETDYNSLTMEIWTDGRIRPLDALRKATLILRDHLTPFLSVAGDNGEDFITPLSDEDKKLLDMLTMNVREMGLSVRSKNCLDSARLATVAELVLKTENEMLKYRNFGKKSLDEIKEKLEEMGLYLGMPIPEVVRLALPKTLDKGDN
ncbi:MAG: DNA-directed RNA polymerase subunit alpha [Lentisphaeria bacterium]